MTCRQSFLSSIYRNDSKRFVTATSAAAILACILVLASIVGAQVEPPIEDFSRLDRLAQFRSFVKVGSFSSYDRTGGNDDGFSGKYSFIRKEDAAGENQLFLQLKAADEKKKQPFRTDLVHIICQRQ
jgi:hypothetical protein